MEIAYICGKQVGGRNLLSDCTTRLDNDFINYAKRTMDTTTVQRLISEALKQSPSSGNGFGFGVAVMVAVCAVCLGVAFIVWKALRSDNRRNWQAENEARIEARRQFREDITARFDRLESQSEKAFGAIADDAKQDRVSIADLDKRITRLEFATKSPPKEGG